MNSLLGVLLWQILLLGAPGLIFQILLGLHSDLTYLLTLPGCLVVLLTAARRQVPRRTFAAAGSVHVLGLVVMFEYHRRSNTDLNAALAFETGWDAMATVFRSLTGWGLTGAAALILSVSALAYAVYLCALDVGVRAIHRAPPRHALPLIVVLTVIAGLFARSGVTLYRGVRDLRAAVAQIAARVPPPPPSGARESVLILHLESVNAGAMFAHRGDDFEWRAPFPGLRQLWQTGHGILYPFFWSNTFATNRGIESLLCGVTGNLGRDMGVDKRPNSPCLPEILRERGYRTPFYYSYFDLDFYGFRNFLPGMGFSQVLYGPELMREGDRRFRWGYDDCAFYDRVGEKLAKDDGSPFFAYVEVSMHHAPFDGEIRYPEAWPHAKPQSYREFYVNSLSEQDHCLPRFGEALKKLRQPTHVFVVGDHSVPLEKKFDLEDRFMTSLLYMPPAGREPHAIVSDAPPSQADLFSTIIDLLYAVTAPNSFADALRGGVSRPVCTTLANQYGVLAYARSGERARYVIDDGEATIESREGARRDDVSFAGFIEKYSCQR